MKWFYPTIPKPKIAKSKQAQTEIPQKILQENNLFAFLLFENNFSDFLIPPKLSQYFSNGVLDFFQRENS